jgi:hypothetical protein
VGGWSGCLLQGMEVVRMMMFERSDRANGNLGTYHRFRVAYMSIILSALW